jgi:opacity protein-like surface antigen
MKKTFVSMMAAAAVIGAASAAQAQNSPFAVELRAGLAFPSGDLKDIDEEEGIETESGVGVNLNASYQVTPMVALYGEYSWLQFGIKDVDDADVTDQGFGAGVKLSFQTPGMTPFLKAGIAMHQIELSVEDFSTDIEDENLGFRVGGGVEIPLGNRLSVTPGATFTTYSIGDDSEDDATISHFTVDVGMKLRL